MSKNPSKSPNLKKGKSLARKRLLDLAGSLSGPPSTCTSGSVELLSEDEVDPDVSTASNSTSPSSADDSVADRHYNPDKDAGVLDHDEEDDMDVDSDDPEENSPLVKSVKSHVKSCLLEIPEPHHKDRKKNPVWNYFKKKLVVVDSTGLIKKQKGICQVMVDGVICGKVMSMPQASTTGPRNHLRNIHPKIWLEFKAIEQAKTQVLRGTTRALNSAMDLIEG